MRRLIAVSTLALLLIFGCVQGALWQYERYEVRHANNELIRKNVSIAAPLTEDDLGSKTASEIAWRSISLEGNFDPSKEFLIRNRYHEGKYGFGVITLFISDSGKRYWIDRGWVIAGKDAQTPPVVQKVDSLPVEITARVRTSEIETRVKGSVFALPGADSTPKLVKWNSEQAIETEPIYFDLISSSNPEVTPEVATALPELSDGPHLAYSFQWILFIFLVLFAWYLVIREDRKAQAPKL
jgi:cytochrome oxidase assembly protein ShyY1